MAVFHAFFRYVGRHLEPITRGAGNQLSPGWMVTSVTLAPPTLFSSHLLSTHYLAQKCTGVVFVFVFDRLQFNQLCAYKWPLLQKKFGRSSLCWCQYCQALTATRVKKLNMVQNIPNQFGQKYNLKVIMRTLPIYIYIYMYVVMIKSMPNIMFQNMAMCSGTGLEGCHPLW